MMPAQTAAMIGCVNAAAQRGSSDAARGHPDRARTSSPSRGPGEHAGRRRRNSGRPRRRGVRASTTAGRIAARPSERSRTTRSDCPRPPPTTYAMFFVNPSQTSRNPWYMRTADAVLRAARRASGSPPAWLATARRTSSIDRMPSAPRGLRWRRRRDRRTGCRRLLPRRASRGRSRFARKAGPK